MISFFFFAVSFREQPFVAPRRNHVKMFTEFQIFGILLVCLIIQVDEKGFDTEYVTIDAYGVIQTVLMVAIIPAAVYFIALTCRDLKDETKEGIEKLSHRDDHDIETDDHKNMTNQADEATPEPQPQPPTASAPGGGATDAPVLPMKDYSPDNEGDAAALREEVARLQAEAKQAKATADNLKQDELRALQDKNKAQEDELRAQQHELKAQQDELKAQEDELKAQQDELKALQDYIKALKRDLKRQPKPKRPPTPEPGEGGASPEPEVQP
jgi:hypothetical protein